MGGFKAQGKSADAARVLMDDALAMAEAGCFAIVLEAMPAPVAERITAAVTPVVPEVGFDVCYDAGGYDVLDESGTSIVPADRVDRQVLELHVLNYGYPDQSQWRVGFVIAPDPAEPC